MRVLLVEDDPVLRDVLARSLTAAGHAVDSVGDMAGADHLWKVQPFDVVILDLNLPETSGPSTRLGNGLDLIRIARRRGDRTPVLVLTARNRTDERVAGLKAGADDYLGKPFELDEVEARLHALVRRARSYLDDVQTVADLTLDRIHRRFSVQGLELTLPAREFQVLWELMSPVGRVVSKSDLAGKISDLDDLLEPNALEAFVSRLRKKLSGSGVRIRTLRGLGYLLEPGEE